MEILMVAHFLFMAITLILVVSAATKAHRKKAGWFELHRKMAVSGVLTSAIAFFSVLVFKTVMHYVHFQSPHAIGGLATIALLIMTPVAGRLIPSNPVQLRPVHRTMGRITLLAVVANAILGVAMFLEISK